RQIVRQSISKALDLVRSWDRAKSIRSSYFALVANEKTNGFGIADFTRSRTFARSDFRRAKDRLVLVGPSRRKIFFINRIGAADRKNGFPNPGRAGYLDHVQRINRRVSHRVRVFDKITCRQSRARNGRSALYQCSTRRRLAQGGALFNHLHYLDLDRSRRIFPGSLSKAQEIARRNAIEVSVVRDRISRSVS